MKRGEGMVQMLVGGMLSLGMVHGILTLMRLYRDEEGREAWVCSIVLVSFVIPLGAFVWLVVSGARHWREGQREALGRIVAQATMPLRAHAAVVVWLGYFALFNFLRGSVVWSLELEPASSASYLLATRMAGGVLLIAAGTFRARWAGEGLSHSGRAALCQDSSRWVGWGSLPLLARCGCCLLLCALRHGWWCSIASRMLCWHYGCRCSWGIPGGLVRLGGDCGDFSCRG